jgi:hypothetical protein
MVTVNVLATSGRGVNLIGNVAAANTLVGTGSANTWNISGSNAGTFSSLRGVASFSGFQNLTGGAASNTFVFSDGAGIDGALTGGGADTLDYSPYTTSVVVNLQTGFATGVGGSVSGITVVFGGSGNGAPGAYNLLIGGAAGGDTLNGGLGRRNILVAGGGASTLNGRNQDDLLIGGTTQYDTEPGLASWLQIANEWAGIDDYATRLALLSTPGSGVPLLDATTVTGNGGNNVMSGSGELAWIFTDGLDTIIGFDPASQQVLIAP